VDQIIEKFANRKSGLDKTSLDNGNLSEQNNSSLESRLEGMEDPFKENFAKLDLIVRKTSLFSSYKTYSLKMMIVKANDDLR
jgi:hypothetical protein